MEATPDERVLVSVKDQGKGIPAEAQTRIFERFYRVDGGDAQVVYGHGLGLYITKILVNAMEGDIWVESEPGQGSQFTFNLPMARTSAVLEEKPIETQNPGH
jgi:signal transduction histidine kinase